MLWVLKRRDGSFEHPKHMFELMDKKIITILRIYFWLNWPYEYGSKGRFSPKTKFLATTCCQCTFKREAIHIYFYLLS